MNYDFFFRTNISISLHWKCSACARFSFFAYCWLVRIVWPMSMKINRSTLRWCGFHWWFFFSQICLILFSANRMRIKGMRKALLEIYFLGKTTVVWNICVRLMNEYERRFRCEIWWQESRTNHNWEIFFFRRVRHNQIMTRVLWRCRPTYYFCVKALSTLPRKKSFKIVINGRFLFFFSRV